MPNQHDEIKNKAAGRLHDAEAAAKAKATAKARAKAKAEAASQRAAHAKWLRQRAARVAARDRAERAAEVARASRSQARTALYSGNPRDIGRQLAAERGWTGSQWGCLDSLFQRESGWSTHASNGSSGAYGIPQALPGSKMSSAGPDWQNSPVTQIKWGLGYISGRYGTPCAAWSHSQSSGWY
jgi:membrane protein involved in colicin uptake